MSVQAKNDEKGNPAEHVYRQGASKISLFGSIFPSGDPRKCVRFYFDKQQWEGNPKLRCCCLKQESKGSMTQVDN